MIKLKCSICKVKKAQSNFFRNCRSNNGYQKHCKLCHKIMADNWRHTNPEEKRRFGRESMARWRKKNPQRVKEINKKYRLLYGEKYKQHSRMKNRELKEKVVKEYGGKCECCGISDYRFLCIDHKNNDGYSHRKNVHAGVALYRSLIKHNFPSTFRLLCFNCNFARAFYGGKDKICPHKQEARQVSD